MRKPFQSSSTLRAIWIFSFMAFSLLIGCGKLRSLIGLKGSENPHSVTIGWSASNPPVAGYNVYRALTPGAPVKLTVRMISDTQYTDKTVEAGKTYVYSVTSIDFKGIESSPSANITVTVPTTVASPARQ
jgi:hypothetical protein